MSTSNPSDRGTYHHGDLRNALIEAGVRLLATTPPEALSLRQLAKEAGVSHNAPYMHFSDKEALIAAIAEQGFRMLSRYVRAEVAAAHGSWGERFAQGCWGYVRFALENPAHFQVMSRRFVTPPDSALHDAGREAFGLLCGYIAEGQGQGELVAGDPIEIAVGLWATMHGLAGILSADKLPPGLGDTIEPRDLVVGTIRRQLTGLGRNA